MVHAVGLAQVALGPAACSAAFDDLLVLTVRTADGDKSHGPPPCFRTDHYPELP